MKCCQYGELSDRRRALPAMRYPHPLHIMETSFMESDTRLGEKACQFCVALIPLVKIISPHARLAWDFYFPRSKANTGCVAAHI